MLGFAGTRDWVYVQHVDGRYQRIRRWTFAGLHLLLFVLPWVRIGGAQALRFDLEERRLYAFGAIFSAGDTVLLLLVLLFLAFSLFFFTSLYGRLWCGYGCPQTVLLDSWVRPIERWIEGERTTRLRRDGAGWTWDRAWRKGAKWGLYALAALLVSASFMSFFAGAPELWSGGAGPAEYALTGIFATAWFADFAWFREQFCNYLCPYARFQSAMTDDRTVLVGYDPRRGDPRGGKAAKVEGRCIECRKCVNVCPQGIDIRDGFQLECINCAACVDACTGVMEKLGHETLISYTSLAELAGKPARKLRPRVLAYAALLLVIAGTMTVLVATRTPFEAAVTRAPGGLYVVDPDGFVRNTYLLRIDNNTPGTEAIPFTVELEGLPGAELIVPDITLLSTGHQIVPMVVRMPALEGRARTLPLRVRVASPTAERVIQATFKSGGAEGAHP